MPANTKFIAVNEMLILNSILFAKHKFRFQLSLSGLILRPSYVPPGPGHSPRLIACRSYLQIGSYFLYNLGCVFFGCFPLNFGIVSESTKIYNFCDFIVCE